MFRSAQSVLQRSEPFSAVIDLPNSAVVAQAPACTGEFGVVSSADLNALDPPRRDPGGKAKRLYELQQAGFNVPPFVVSPTDIEAAVQLLGTPLVVRSSASHEDNAQQSFAGQFCSYLNLRTVDEVAQAIEQCYRSVETPALQGYCRRHNIDPSLIKMNVIVQHMVEPELAGVAFTVNPATGEQQMVIEACIGLADRLLAGRDDALPDDHPLLRRYRPMIEQTGRAIQRHFGSPQDFEFAISHGTLYVVQSRPITRINFPPQVGVWTNADFRDGGVSSGVCTPLMWSLYELAWDRALKGTLRELRLGHDDFVAARLFFGRPYWNLGAVKSCVAKLPGFVERDFDNDLSVQTNYEGDGLHTPLTPARVLRAIPTLWAIQRFFRKQERCARQFLAAELSQPAGQPDSFGKDIEAAFHQVIERDFLNTECNYFRTIFAASLAKLDLLTAFPQANDQSLLSALPPLRHMEPVRLVQAMPDRNESQLADIVARFRHHYRHGLDICFPRWDEDCEFVIQMLGELPPASNGDGREWYESALSAVRTEIAKWRRKSFEHKLARLRNFVWLREEMRDLSSRMYYSIRRHALEIARRRQLGDDIFFMTCREVLADDRSRVQQNREIYESYRNFAAPNEIGLGQEPSDVAATGAHWQGLAASTGLANGPAYVARNVADAATMPAGQILVCPFTDPGWTPVLSRAAGVVTETGGLLSHAAVICREFGIPAVLGVSGATKQIRHGQHIVVDGDQAVVLTE